MIGVDFTILLFLMHNILYQVRLIYTCDNTMFALFFLGLVVYIIFMALNSMISVGILPFLTLLTPDLGPTSEGRATVGFHPLFGQ